MIHTYVLIGHPVGHSISPAIHGAAYRALGLADRSYVAVDCPDETAVRGQLERLREGEIHGANVTVPWKRFALESADEADPVAADTGAANVIVAAEASGKRRLIAHNTDVGALADELASGREGARSAVVIGSGGAALAAVVACRSIGVTNIGVTARKWRGPQDAWPRSPEFARLGATPLAWPDDEGTRCAWNDACRKSDIVVQTTSAGMKGADSGSSVAEMVPWSALDDRAFAYDVVYNPPATPFLDAARARRIAHRGGLGMLVRQAAKALTLWLGVEAPLGAMWQAAEQALEARRSNA